MHLHGLDDIHFNLAQGSSPPMLGEPDYAIGSRTQGLITREAISLHKGSVAGHSQPGMDVKFPPPATSAECNIVSGCFRFPKVSKNSQFTIFNIKAHNQQVSVMFNCPVSSYIMYHISADPGRQQGGARQGIEVIILV